MRKLWLALLLLAAWPASAQLVILPNGGGGGGGGGTVTSLTAASNSCAVLTPTPITGTGTIGIGYPARVLTAPTDTVLAADNCKYLQGGASAVALSLPQAGSAGFGDGFLIDIEVPNGGAAISITALGGSTINNNGTSLTVSANQGCGLRSNGTNWDLVACTAVAPAGVLASAFPSFMGGLTGSNDVSTPNTVIDVASGAAMSDDATQMMVLASAFTKTTGSWAVGTGNGCLDTGAVANSTWYHLFVIERTDTLVVDLLCSTSASSPTMPASYTKKRRAFSFKTNGSAQIIAFTQIGTWFYWATATLDVNAVTITTSAALQTLNVPSGVKVQPLCRWSISNATGAGALLTSPDETDVAPATGLAFSSTPGWDKDVFGVGAGEANGNCSLLTTNASGQVRARASAASTSLSIATRGWIE